MDKQSLRAVALRFWGKVRTHKKRGRDLGFPTANVNLHQQIPEGIYISETKIAGKIFPSLTFIGIAKTFKETKYQAETYILDFKQNIYKRSLKSELTNSLYNQWISVKLLKKIRNNQKFNSPKELIEQMKKDEEEARKYFSSRF